MTEQERTEIISRFAKMAADVNSERRIISTSGGSVHLRLSAFLELFQEGEYSCKRIESGSRSWDYYEAMSMDTAFYAVGNLKED